MEKEQYNIDDILAEVKKHREAQEKRENSTGETPQEPVEQKAEEKAANVQEEQKDSAGENGGEEK